MAVLFIIKGENRRLTMEEIKEVLADAKQHKLISLGAVILFLVIITAIVGGSKNTPTHQPKSAVSTSTQSVSKPTVAAVTPPAQPQVLLNLSGEGNQNTQPFTTTGEWTVTYTYDCSNDAGQGNFIYNVANTDGSDNNDNGANELGASGGTTDTYYDAGQHYLSIDSECNWTVTVKG
jgi:hypothetical protein